MAPQSAGVLLYRLTDTGLEVLLVHSGGPFWRNKQIGAWQLPKGLIEAGEAPETAARREVEEELGIAISGTLLPLGSIRQAGGKIVHAFACEGTFDPADLHSQTFDLEWPPRSGRQMRFPEIDAARWMPLSEASDWILPSQRPVLGRLEQTLVL